MLRLATDTYQMPIETLVQSAMSQLNIDTNPRVESREFQLSIDIHMIAEQMRGRGRSAH